MVGSFRPSLNIVRMAAVVAILLPFGSHCQVRDEAVLASQLANRSQRQRAIDRLSLSDTLTRAILLKWTTETPAGVERFQFNLGLTLAFKKLRMVEAVPYLIDHINMREIDLDVWGANSAVTLNQSPAMQALVDVGQPAVEPLIRAWYAPRNPEDRLAIVFTLGYIRSPNAIEFFRRVQAFTRTEGYYAQQAIKRAEPAANPDR